MKTRIDTVIVSIISISALVGAAVVGKTLYDSVWEDPPPPPTVIQPVAQTALRPFVVGPTTCVGLVSQRVQTVAKRDNKITLPWFPDINPPGEDRYYANVVVESRLCADGIDGIGDRSPIKAVTTEQGINVIVNQQAGVFTIDPRVNARLCTSQEWAANEPCMSLSGGPSIATQIFEIAPFTASGNALQQRALAAAQVYGYSPDCLSAGFSSISGTSFYETLLASFRWQAQQQGLDVDSVSLTLLDTRGQPTTEWDPAFQQRKYEEELDRLDLALPDGSELGVYSVDCDISGFGLAAPDDSSIVPPPAASTPTSIEPATSIPMSDFFPTAPTDPGTYVTVPKED